ncbi:MAG: tRNA pseudouridine(55) synthase TruB [Bacteroidota bacterium]
MIPHEPAEGEVLFVNKPKGWTSFDVASRVRTLLHARKVGHAGTLDPMATGLLILCTEKRTKDIEQFQGQEKEYRVRMLLGARTPSFDAETPVSERHSTDDLTVDSVVAVMQEFVGHQQQLPPMWSAVKVHGKRLYKHARKGQEVERPLREVFIRSIEVNESTMPNVEFTVVCSKGTYVRALVNDVGNRLGCGAYVTALERTRIGEYLLRDALTLEELGQRQALHVEQHV